MNGSRWERWSTYWAECARLPYWAYFKPFTLAEHLRCIHPDLGPTTNPFRLRHEFEANPALARYARQVAHLAQIVPLLAVFLVGGLITLTGQSFDWFSSLGFALSFVIGVWFATRPTGHILEKWGDRFLKLSGLLFGIFVVFRVLQWLSPDAAESILNRLAIILAFLPRDTVSGLVDWLPLLYRVAVGVVGGVAFGVEVGVAGGMAVGVSMVAGALRLYFWPFEVLWMVYLWLAAPGERAGQVLQWLPIYYDEFIVLPLPLLGHFLARAYRYNQAGARRAIDCLTTHSRQQRAARQAQVLIALDWLARCDNTSEIAAVSDELRWIAQPPPPELGRTLPALLDVSQGVRAALQATTRYRQQLGLQRQLDQLRALRESLVTGESRPLC